MGIVTLPHTLTPGTPENVSHVQANDEALRDVINGSLDADNLANGAVTYLKTATGSSGLAVGLVRATMSGNQTVGASTTSKITFNTEALDVSGWFDSATNYRFTPLVAGYYRLTAYVDWSGASDVLTHVYKNGSTYQSWSATLASATFSQSLGGSTIVQADGSTDYFEVFGANADTSAAATARSARSYFEAELIGRA